MIGVDIVALGAVSNSFTIRKDRFLNKLFTIDEQQLITNSSSPENAVWLLWSMKESAWKAHQHLDGKRLFNPKSFECQISPDFNPNQSIYGRVEAFDEIYTTHSVLNSKFVYSVAGVQDADIQSFVVNFNNDSSAIQSSFLKEQLLAQVAIIQNVQLSALELVKSQSGIPKITFNGKLLPVNCSLSHHGPFGAYALSL
jgi:phosphopantetheine--protein transferase-like protein